MRSPSPREREKLRRVFSPGTTAGRLPVPRAAAEWRASHHQCRTDQHGAGDGRLSRSWSMGPPGAPRLIVQGRERTARFPRFALERGYRFDRNGRVEAKAQNMDTRIVPRPRTAQLRRPSILTIGGLRGGRSTNVPLPAPRSWPRADHPESSSSRVTMHRDQCAVFDVRKQDVTPFVPAPPSCVAVYGKPGRTNKMVKRTPLLRGCVRRAAV